MKRYLFTLLASSVMASLPVGLLAQTTDTQPEEVKSGTVRIALEREVNGLTVKTDTTIVLAPGTDLKQVLEQFGLGAQTELDGLGEDLEIIINKRAGLDEDLQELRLEFNELIPDLRDLQSMLREVQDQILVFQAPENQNRAFLGIYYDSEVTEQGNITSITQVIEGSGAEEAGLLAGDQILGINGQKFTQEQDLRSALVPFEPGDEIALMVYRANESGGEQLTLKAVLGTSKEAHAFQWQNEDKSFEFNWDEGDMDFNNLPFAFDDLASVELAQKPFLGVYLDYSSEEGVRISGAMAGTTAEEMGLLKGDILTEINGEPVSDITGLKEILSRQPIGESIAVQYMRDGKQMKAKGTLKGSGESMHQGSMRLKQGLQAPIGNLEEMIQQELIQSGQVISEDLLRDLEQLRALENLDIFFSGDPAVAGEDVFRDLPSRVVRRVAIFITMDNLSDSDLEQLNQHAEPKVSAQNDLTVDGVFFSPNPNDGQFVLNYTLQESGETLVQLYDINGRQVFVKSFSGTPGTYAEQINISEEPKGVYFLSVIQNGKSFAKKVVVQ